MSYRIQLNTLNIYVEISITHFKQNKIFYTLYGGIVAFPDPHLYELFFHLISDTFKQNYQIKSQLRGQMRVYINSKMSLH